MKPSLLRTILLLSVLALLAGPVATSVFVLGFGFGDSPCVLCWAQRTAMVLIALTGLFVLRFGPRPRYLGFGILVAAWGVYMGIRHAGLHVGRDVGQGFSVEILGAHTYTWSALIFWACLVAMGGLLMALRDGEAARGATREANGLERLALWLFLLVVAGNIAQAFASTGPPPFMGQSDPVRFSFNPKFWVWSLEEWSPAPVSLRGRWAIEKPDVSTLSTDPAQGPFSGLPTLAVSRRFQLALPLNGPVTDLAYDAASDRFLLSTANGIYLADGALERIVRRTVVDTGFSVDLARFGAATFLDSQTVIALSENKSYVVLRENDQADAVVNYRFFVESPDRFDEVARSRLATVRARMMYVLSLAYDPMADAIYTVSVPNARTRRLVVSRFDRRDMTLSAEFQPSLGPGLTLRGKDRSLNELYVSGATFVNGRVLAVSAIDGVVVTIDPGSQTLVAAHSVAGLERPVGIARKGDDIYLVGQQGVVTVALAPTITER